MKGVLVAKSVVEVLVDDLDGSEAVESVRIGWNGEWRQIELSDKNRVALHKALDRFWQAARPVKWDEAKSKRKHRDVAAIRAWVKANGIDCPAYGRIPFAVEEAYNAANGR